VGFRADALEVALYAADGGDSVDESSFNLQADYAVSDAVAVTASFGQVDAASVTTTYIQANVAYTVDATTYALGGASKDSDASGVDTKTGIYANVTTKLAPSVKVYAEVGYADDDAFAEDFGYVAGMEVKF
jgi:hypothetical protein